jgi:hypothetical protein
MDVLNERADGFIQYKTAGGAVVVVVSDKPRKPKRVARDTETADLFGNAAGCEDTRHLPEGAN